MKKLFTAASFAFFLFILASLPTTAPAQVPNVARARLALETAQAVYLLPNLRLALKNDAYLAAFQEFEKAKPAGYEIYGADADLKSGLKFAIYRPVDRQGDEPWVLALTGTEELIDWMSNTDMARGQMLGLRKIVTLFNSNFIPDKELLITGHSLGGALAQAVAYEIQRERAVKNLTRRKLTVITWNGFGAQELIERFESYRPELAAKIEIANYFIRGDVVSQIGHHFGPAYEVVPPPNVATASGLKSVLELHSLELFQALLPTPAFSGALPTPPPYAKKINALGEVTGLIIAFNRQVQKFRKWPVVREFNSPLDNLTIHESRQLWLVRRVIAMLDGVKTTEQLRAHEAAYMYLYNVGSTEKIRLNAEKNPVKARDYVNLRDTLSRFANLKNQP